MIVRADQARASTVRAWFSFVFDSFQQYRTDANDGSAVPRHPLRGHPVYAGVFIRTHRRLIPVSFSGKS